MMTTPVNFIILKNQLLESATDTNFIFEKSIDDDFEFTSMESSLFSNNLKMVDGLLPNILSEILLYAYKEESYSLLAITEVFDITNPLKLQYSKGVEFYKYKLKEFLRHLALGMSSDNVWHGEPNIYDYFPVIKKGDEIIYYSDSINRFVELLLQYSYITIDKVNVVTKGNRTYLHLNLGIVLIIEP